MNIIVLKIPRTILGLLRRFPGWRQTLLKRGEQISVHLHQFLAIYFTSGISSLHTEEGLTPLPQQAMVIVPRGKRHGWKVEDVVGLSGFVGHFHSGHDAHHVTA